MAIRLDLGYVRPDVFSQDAQTKDEIRSRMSRETFYITTAISYPNGSPHIGHAYELIATDAIARFNRHDGKDVLFLSGTDEHGIKMLQTARKGGHFAARACGQKCQAFP